MSALPLLSEDKQTSGEQAINDANDPRQTFGYAVVRLVLSLLDERKRPSSKLPFHQIEGFVEALIAVLIGFSIWGFYGFPHFTIVAIGTAAFGCFAAYAWWPKSRS